MDFELAMALEKHNQTIKTNQTHAELTADKLKRAEEKVLQKDLEDARKSYRFKQKTLKL
jgi:monomeric isocitrate dehydrogenase